MVKLVDTLLLGSSAKCISVRVRVAASSKRDTIDFKMRIYLTIKIAHYTIRIFYDIYNFRTYIHSYI